MTTRKLLIALLALALGLTGVGAAAAASTKTVTLKNIAITPAKVTIKKGAKVKWVWKDGSIRHDVTFRNGAFKASRLQSAGSYTLTFRKKGTYRYYCSVHPGDMQGRVVVT